jgi:hypothetical protein
MRGGELSSQSNGGGRRDEGLDLDRLSFPTAARPTLKNLPRRDFRANIPARSPVQGKAGGVFRARARGPDRASPGLKGEEAVRQINFGDGEGRFSDKSCRDKRHLSSYSMHRASSFLPRQNSPRWELVLNRPGCGTPSLSMPLFHHGNMVGTLQGAVSYGVPWIVPSNPEPLLGKG